MLRFAYLEVAAEVVDAIFLLVLAGGAAGHVGVAELADFLSLLDAQVEVHFAVVGFSEQFLGNVRDADASVEVHLLFPIGQRY